MVAASALAGVARMLVFQANRLDEAHRIQVAGCRRRMGQVEKLRLVSQMGSSGCSGCKAGVVVEGLVMVLKDFVRAIGVDRVRARVRVRARSRNGAVGPARSANVAVGIRPTT